MCILGGWVGRELALEAEILIQRLLNSLTEEQNADSPLAAASEGQVLAQGRVLLRIWLVEQQKQHHWELVRNVESQTPPSPPGQELGDGPSRGHFKEPPGDSDADVG